MLTKDIEKHLAKEDEKRLQKTTRKRRKDNRTNNHRPEGSYESEYGPRERRNVCFSEYARLGLERQATQMGLKSISSLIEAIGVGKLPDDRSIEVKFDPIPLSDYELACLEEEQEKINHVLTQQSCDPDNSDQPFCEDQCALEHTHRQQIVADNPLLAGTADPSQHFCDTEALSPPETHHQN